MNIEDKLVDTFQNRLVKAMDLRGMKQVDLAEKSELSKQQISQYVNGKFKAKQNAIYSLAKALNVSEAWLMGLDHPMERQDYTSPKTIAAHATEDLTEEEQEKVREYIQFLKMKRGL